MLAVNGLALKAQYVDNKFDIGFGSSLSLPLNSSTIILNNEFHYPSLFGNYTAGKGISAVLDYHITPNLRIGAQLDYTVYGNWKGEQDKFLLSQPGVSISSVAINTIYFPKRFQLETSSVQWAWSVSPLISYHILDWQEEIENSSQQIASQATLNGGFKTGICLFYEINNLNLLRMDIFYQLEKVDNIYYLDQYYHSLNVAFYISFKLSKNRYFNYE